MSKLNGKKITHNKKEYAVCQMQYKSHNVPVVLDFDVYTKIKSFDKKWHITEKGIVVTNHKICKNNEVISKDVSLHDVVMAINGEIEKISPILHINKLGVDNRRENLMYDTTDKTITKNLKKKSRTISLPKSYGIDPEEIPSYVWYVKEDDTHGDRFMIELGDIKWKSTCSKKVSLKYKLEETKKYLRHLRDEMEDFEMFSMNGDLNNDGVWLLSSFFEISREAGFNNIKENMLIDNTTYYLKEDHKGLSNEEIQLLQMFNPKGDRLNFRV